MKRPKWPYILMAVFVVVAAVVVAASLPYLTRPDTGPAYGRTSVDSAKLNEAYLNYVRMNNPELESEPNGNLLVVGYKVCSELHAFSETVLIYNIEMKYPNAGQRIYDGATQYLCQEGS